MKIGRFSSIQHVYYICGHIGFVVEIHVRSSNTTTAVSEQAHRSRLASRRGRWRWGSQVHTGRAGEAWTGPNRCFVRRERGIARTRVARTKLTAKLFNSRGKAVRIFVPYVRTQVQIHTSYKRKNRRASRAFFINIGLRQAKVVHTNPCLTYNNSMIQNGWQYSI